MSGSMSEFMESFVSDASELLDTCEDALLEMEEKCLQGMELQVNLDAVFRGLHTLKGTAAFLGLNLISEMAHSLEDLFQPTREKCQVPGGEVLNCLFEGISLFREMFEGLSKGSPEDTWSSEAAPFLEKTCGDARKGTENNATPDTLGSHQAPDTGTGEDVPASCSESDQDATLKKEAGQEQKVDEEGPEGQVSQGKGNESGRRASEKADKARSRASGTGSSASVQKQSEPFLKVRASKVDLLMDLVGNIGIAIGEAFNHPDLQDLELEGFNEAAHRVNVLMRQLQDEAAGLRLVAVAGAFRPMQRLVRDLARSTGKKLKLVTEGADTELDKVVVERLNDPLVHMVRNAADHGIETPEERVAAGKPETGTIKLKASQRGGEVLIEVSDDGRGLNREAILKKARQKGLIGQDEVPDDSRIWNLIFHPGFSTSEQVTSISGRGVGMDVVQNTIKELRGRITVESSPGKGSSVVMHIPLTLAFLDSMIVSESNINYAIPIEVVCEIMQPAPEQLTVSSADKSKFVRVRDDLVPIFSLREFYGLDNRRNGGGKWSADTEVTGNMMEEATDDEAGAEKLHQKEDDQNSTGRADIPLLLIVQAGDRPLAIPVDRIAGQQQVTIKPLQGQAKSIRAGAGWALLGSGATALVLDCARIAEGGRV